MAKSVQKSSRTPHFEIDYKTRLEQRSRAINDVVRPRCGFKKYRVYDLDSLESKIVKNASYGNIYSGIQKGQITYISSSQHSKTLQTKSNGKYIMYSFFFDEYYVPSYKTKWLKPKQVTFLQLKGHRVVEV